MPEILLAGTSTENASNNFAHALNYLKHVSVKFSCLRKNALGLSTSLFYATLTSEESKTSIISAGTSEST